jgi:hypothetical protein
MNFVSLPSVPHTVQNINTKPLALMPMMIPIVPSFVASPPMIQGTFVQLPANVSPLFFNGTTWFKECPANLKKFDSQGNMIPPAGFSFISMSVPASVSASFSQSRSTSDCQQDRLPIPQAPSQTRSRSSSPMPSLPPISESTNSRHSSSDTHTTEGDDRKQNKKFRHRSKQERILEVHAELKETYTAKGLYAGKDEVLRGHDTIRVHVKTYQALNVINRPLQEVEDHPQVTILKIATPFSMKNKFQKKGFIVYMKLAKIEQVPLVQNIFAKYSQHFQKCDVALTKEEKLAQDRRLNSLRSATLPELADFSSCSSMSVNAAALAEQQSLKKPFSWVDEAPTHWDDAWQLAPPAMQRVGSGLAA